MNLQLWLKPFQTFKNHATTKKQWQFSNLGHCLDAFDLWNILDHHNSAVNSGSDRQSSNLRNRLKMHQDSFTDVDDQNWTSVAWQLNRIQI